MQESAWSLIIYAAADRQAVVSALRRGETGGAGPARLCLVAAGGRDLIDRQRSALAILEAATDGPVPFRLTDGVYFRDEPLRGEIAFLFGGVGGAYPGMGRDLMRAFPEVRARALQQMPTADATSRGGLDDAVFSPADRLAGGAFLTAVHVAFTRDVLGVAPQAAIGMSLGEVTALFALGVWDDPEGYFADLLASGAFDRELAGEFRAVQRSWQCTPAEAARFQNWRVLAPVADVRAALAGEARAHITTVHTPNDMIIGGEADACARALARLTGARTFRFPNDMAVHCPEVAAFAETWRRLHDRPTRPVPGIRFYTHATGGTLTLRREAVAEAMTRQAMQTIQFPQVIENAWNDGVRLFLEHGPQAGMPGFVSRILGDREHLAVAMDSASEPSLDQALNVAAQLMAAGVPLSGRLTERLQARLQVGE